MAKKGEEVKSDKLTAKVTGELKLKKMSSEGVAFSMELDKASIKRLDNDSILFDLKTLPDDFDFDKHILSGVIEITLTAKEKSK